MPERPIDPNRVPASKAFERFVEEVLVSIQKLEKAQGLRKRERRPVDQQNFVRTVSSLLSDLAWCFLEDPERWLYLGLSHRLLGKRSRYDQNKFGSTLPYILKVMNILELLELNVGAQLIQEHEKGRRIIRKQTTIRATKGFASWIKGQKIGFDDLAYSPNEEIIILKDAKETYSDSGKWIEYADTKDTDRWRQNLRRINDFLSQSDITYSGGANINAKDRRLRRFFSNGSFENGGRHFGGFWQSLGKRDRLEHIEINGQEVVELDYGQMALRLLYGKEGIKPPEGDLYAVPRFARYRDGVKLLINSALFAEQQQARMPRGGRDYFPARFKYQEVMEAISAYHRPISHRFFTGVGMHLMFLESEVMHELLLTAVANRWVVLPIHDALLVPISDVEPIKYTMLGVFYAISGAQGVVTVERADRGKAEKE